MTLTTDVARISKLKSDQDDLKVAILKKLVDTIKRYRVPPTTIQPVVEALNATLSSTNPELRAAAQAAENYFRKRIASQEDSKRAEAILSKIRASPSHSPEAASRKLQTSPPEKASFPQMSGTAIRDITNIKPTSRSGLKKDAKVHSEVDFKSSNTAPGQATVHGTHTSATITAQKTHMSKSVASVPGVTTQVLPSNTAPGHVTVHGGSFTSITDVVDKEASSTGSARPTSNAQRTTLYDGNDSYPSESIVDPRKQDSRLHNKEAKSATAPRGPALSETESKVIAPSDMYSSKELEELFRSFEPLFSETDDENWMRKQDAVEKLRSISRGNSPVDFRGAYISGMRSVSDGLLRCVSSLRSTLSGHACLLVVDMAAAVGPDMDPMVDQLLPVLIRICANKGSTVSERVANSAIMAMLSSTSFHSRTVQHLAFALEDKSKQLRKYVPVWMDVILDVHARNLETSSAMDTFLQCLEKGLRDADPVVRTGMRQTFFKFASIWQERANGFYSRQENNVQKALEKDPNNPKGVQVATGNTSKRGSVKEHILAVKAKKTVPSSTELEASVVSVIAPVAPAIPVIMADPHPSHPPPGLSSKPVRPMRGLRKIEVTKRTAPDHIKPVLDEMTLNEPAPGPTPPASVENVSTMPRFIASRKENASRQHLGGSRTASARDVKAHAVATSVESQPPPVAKTSPSNDVEPVVISLKSINSRRLSAQKLREVSGTARSDSQRCNVLVALLQDLTRVAMSSNVATADVTLRVENDLETIMAMFHDQKKSGNPFNSEQQGSTLRTIISADGFVRKRAMSAKYEAFVAELIEDGDDHALLDVALSMADTEGAREHYFDRITANRMIRILRVIVALIEKMSRADAAVPKTLQHRLVNMVCNFDDKAHPELRQLSSDLAVALRAALSVSEFSTLLEELEGDKREIVQCSLAIHEMEVTW